MGEADIRPGNLTTLITFDGGAEWSKVQGPRNDTSGHPIPGCFDVSCNFQYLGEHSFLTKSARIHTNYVILETG